MRVEKPLFLAATLAVIGLPVINIINHPYLLQSLQDGQIQCGNMASTYRSDYPYDAIAVPGAGIVKAPDGKVKLHEEGKIRLQAAALAFDTKMAGRIVVMGSFTPHGRKLSLEEEFFLTSSKVPAGAVSKADTSYNTSTDMKELAELAQTEKIRKVAVVTSGYHGKRATILACIFGLSANSFSAEDFLKIPDQDSFKLREFLGTALLFWDPKGSIPTFFSKLREILWR